MLGLLQPTGGRASKEMFDFYQIHRVGNVSVIAPPAVLSKKEAYYVDVCLVEVRLTFGHLFFFREALVNRCVWSTKIRSCEFILVRVVSFFRPVVCVALNFILSEMPFRWHVFG